MSPSIKKPLHKIRVQLMALIKGKKARRGLTNKDFTIISNNCFGGFVYQKYYLKYNTPTIGLFIHADDYIRFLSDLPGYLNGEIRFISYKDSRYYNPDIAVEYPIGFIKDVEIYFMHYKSAFEAEEKWKARAARVNYGNLLIKMSQRDGCTDNDIESFAKLPYENKIIFTGKEYPYDCAIYINGLGGTDKHGTDETSLILSQIDMEHILNNMKR